MKLFRNTPDPEPDEGTRYYALMYAVSLRQRRTVEGLRAYTWEEIHRLTEYPGSLSDLLCSVVLHMDNLERVNVERMHAQRRDMTREYS